MSSNVFPDCLSPIIILGKVHKYLHQCEIISSFRKYGFHMLRQVSHDLLSLPQCKMEVMSLNGRKDLRFHSELEHLQEVLKVPVFHMISHCVLCAQFECEWQAPAGCLPGKEMFSDFVSSTWAPCPPSWLQQLFPNKRRK